MNWKKLSQKNIIPVLFLLLFIPVSIQAQEPSETEINFGAGDIVINDLSNNLDILEQDEQEIRVIVNLELGLEHDISFDEVPIDEQMIMIQSAQEEFIEELYGGLDTDDPLHNFKYVPAIAMTVDGETLGLMLDSPRVNSIVEDVPLFPTLARSIPVIGADNVWIMGHTGLGQTVAILDTGVDNGHPMFTGKIVNESCFSSNSPTHSATSLCPDGSNQQIGPGAAAPCIGLCSHGTHVAGIAAGNQVFSGPVSYEGVAKDSEIIAVQVFTKFNSASQCDPFNRGWATPCVMSYPSDQIKGLEHVFDLRNTHDIAAVNLSLGGDKHTTTCDMTMPSYKDIIDRLHSAGIVSIIASGNDGYTDGIGFPACISSAVSVGSTDNNDVISSFSNNDDILDLLAPGDSIRSAVPGTGLAYKGGTSMAAPHVAGAWAVAKSASPTSSVSDILDSFKTTGMDVTDDRLGSTGASYKRIQLDNAICDLTTCPDAIATGMLSDGTMVSIWTSEPTAGERMEISIEFADSEHVNHDIVVTQDGNEVLSEEDRHHHDGTGVHKTAPLDSDNPVDITITFQGYGNAPLDQRTGPIGEEVIFTNVVPEFGTIAMMVLAVAIISIVAVTTKSRVVPRF